MPPHSFDYSDRFLLDLEFEEFKKALRRKKDLIGELISDLAVEKQPAAFDPEQYLQERLGETKKRLDQLHKEVEIRLDLNAKFVEEIDSQISYAEVSLDRFSNWGVGYNTGVDVKRNHLERELLQLRADRRAAELRAWEDLVRLRKELREAMTEYKAAFRLRRFGDAV